jgi:hypothetical protein
MVFRLLDSVSSIYGRAWKRTPPMASGQQKPCHCGRPSFRSASHAITWETYVGALSTQNICRGSLSPVDSLDRLIEDIRREQQG